MGTARTSGLGSGELSGVHLGRPADLSRSSKESWNWTPNSTSTRSTSYPSPSMPGRSPTRRRRTPANGSTCPAAAVSPLFVVKSCAWRGAGQERRLPASFGGALTCVSSWTPVLTCMLTCRMLPGITDRFRAFRGLTARSGSAGGEPAMTSHQDRDLMTALHDQLCAALAQWTDRASAAGTAIGAIDAMLRRLDLLRGQVTREIRQAGDALR